MPEPVWAAKIDYHTERTHNDGCNGHSFADDDDLVHLFVVVEICRDDHHYTPGGQANTERKVCDVKSPTYMIRHVRANHAADNLMGPSVGTHQSQCGQQSHPGVEDERAFRSQPQRACNETGIAEKYGRIVHRRRQLGCG